MNACILDLPIWAPAWMRGMPFWIIAFCQLCKVTAFSLFCHFPLETALCTPAKYPSGFFAASAVGAVDMMKRLLMETEPLLQPHECPPRSQEANALAHAVAELADDLNAAAVVIPTRTGDTARRLAAFRPSRPILAYSRVPGTTRRLHLVWGGRSVDLTVAPGLDPLHAALGAARRELARGARVIVLDIASAAEIPSVVNTISL